jgi:hypothetical protein
MDSQTYREAVRPMIASFGGHPIDSSLRRLHIRPQDGR